MAKLFARLMRGVISAFVVLSGAYLGVTTLLKQPVASAIAYGCCGTGSPTGGLLIRSLAAFQTQVATALFHLAPHAVLSGATCPLCASVAVEMVSS